MPQEVQEHRRLAARIEKLVQEVAEFPDPHARATAQELVQALLDMYGQGLARLLELTAETEASGLALIDTFASDDLKQNWLKIATSFAPLVKDGPGWAAVYVGPYAGLCAEHLMPCPMTGG